MYIEIAIFVSTQYRLDVVSKSKSDIEASLIGTALLNKVNIKAH